MVSAQTSTWGLQFPNNDSGFTFSPTLITLVMLDGTKVLIAGSDFDANTDAGTVTSMVHVSADGLTTLHTATGMPASLAAVSSSFGNDEAFYGVLVQGDNVVTQVSTGYFVGTDGGAGNDSPEWRRTVKLWWHRSRLQYRDRRCDRQPDGGNRHGWRRQRYADWEFRWDQRL